MKFSELASLALLGTERQDLARPVTDSTVTALQAQLDFERREKRETSLLSAAAIAGVHERAGRLPFQDSVTLPAPSPVETLHPTSRRSGGLLLRMLSGEFPMLFTEWLARAARSQQLAPPEALPALLDVGTRNRQIRDAIAPVIGARGHWLAAQNPEWAWVGGAVESEDIWHTGEGDARLLFLRRLRRNDPGRARDLLIETWKDESPEDRAAFLGVLHVGLSDDDEAFLETVLDDKRKEVRRLAAGLLGRLSVSRLSMRMTDRATSLLRLADGVEVTLPETCDKAMQRDGVELKPPQGIGEKTWWLVQILEAVPLSHWLDEWKVTPARIVAASLASEWKAELLEAWTRASLRQGNAEWAEAILDASTPQEAPARMHSLLGVLSPLRLEARMIPLLAEAQQTDAHGVVILQAKHDWSPEFSRAVLDWLRTVASRQSTDWQLRSELKTVATRIHPTLLPEVSSNWPEDSAGWAFWVKGVEEMSSVAQFRHEMVTALEQSKETA